MASSQSPSSSNSPGNKNNAITFLPNATTLMYNLPNAITSQFMHCDLGDIPCSAQDFFLLCALENGPRSAAFKHHTFSPICLGP